MRYLLIIIFVFTACNRQNKSRTRNLESLASGKSITTQCLSRSAPPRASVKLLASTIIPLAGARNDQVTIQATDALRVIPEEALMFLLYHRAHIIATSDPTSICSGAIQAFSTYKMQFQSKDLASCAVYSPPSKSRPEVLNLVVHSSPAEVSENLVRVAGAAVAQVSAVTDPQGWASMRGFQVNLANRFLQDVEGSGVFRLDDLKGFIGQRLNSGRSLTIDSFDFGGADAGQAGRKSRFLDYVFAESFDSYYCNSEGNYNPALIEAVKRKARPETDLALISNTRERMHGLFPETHNYFKQNIREVLSYLASRASRGTPGRIQSKTNVSANRTVFNLDESKTPVGGYESTWASGASGFFGSIWGNTGGAIGNTYNYYTQKVQEAAYENFTAGDNVLTGTLKAAGGATQDIYSQDIYQPIYDKTTQRYQVQKDGGVDDVTAQINVIGLAIGDNFGGATKFAESIGGADTQAGRILSPSERLTRAGEGSLEALNTITTVASMMPSREVLAATGLPNRVGAGGVARGSIGVTDAAAIERTSGTLRSMVEEGLSQGRYTATEADKIINQRLTSYSQAMGPDAVQAALQPGETAWAAKAVVEGKPVSPNLTWTSRNPPPPEIFAGDKAAMRQFIQDTALPYNVDQVKGFEIVKITAKEPIPTIDSTISEMVFDNGSRGVGGARQTFLVANQNTIERAAEITRGPEALKALNSAVDDYYFQQGVHDAAGVIGTVLQTGNSVENAGGEPEGFRLDSPDVNSGKKAGSVEQDGASSAKPKPQASVAKPTNQEYAVVRKVSGFARLGRQPIFPGMQIPTGDVVSTAANSSLEIEIPSEGLTIGLGKKSSFHVGTSKNDSHHLIAGIAQFSVKKRSAQSPLSIRVGLETFSVIGTEFALVSNPVLKESEIIGLSGSVKYTDRGGKSITVGKNQWGGSGGRFTDGSLKGPFKLEQGVVESLTKSLLD